MVERIKAKARFVFKAKTNEEWALENPILEDGEIGLVNGCTDGNFIKIGDGVTDWNNLDFVTERVNIKGGADGKYSVYQESEKDDTALTLSFSDLPDEDVKTQIAGIYDRTLEGGNNSASLGTSIATGKRALAYGSSNIAAGAGSIAGGADNYAGGTYAHATGYANIASGDEAHAEGALTQATGKHAHSEGDNTKASGDSSHAEGNQSKAIGQYSHAEGGSTTASGGCAHAQGSGTVASGNSSSANGVGTVASKYAQTVVGRYNKESEALFIVGDGTSDTNRHNAFEVFDNGTANIGGKVLATQQYVAEYTDNILSTQNIRGGVDESVHQKSATTAGTYSAAFNQAIANGENATAFGYGATANGFGSIASGGGTVAAGEYTFTQGMRTKAEGYYTFATGCGTHATGTSQMVVGKFNKALNDAYFIVGNGTSDSDRKNAFVVYTNGDIEISGIRITEEKLNKLLELIE